MGGKTPTRQTIRARASVMLIGCALGGAATVLLAPAASAAPDPCAASQVARTIGTVANNTGLYLDTHPETNQALTAIAEQPAGPESLVALKTYFDANPDDAKALQGIQQPLTSLSAKCDLPISLPQVLGLMQAAQQGGGLPGAEALSGLGTGPAPGPRASSPSPVATGAGSAVAGAQPVTNTANTAG